MTAIAVAACLVRGPDGRVLLAERTPRQLSPGFWEAPGGRVDPGETPRQAAVRELEEEVGIQAIDPRPWLTYDHAFPTRRIRLSWFLVDRWTGTPRGREGQRIAWAHPADPPVSPILASNHRALASLTLPPLYLDASVGDGGLEARLERLQRAFASGARLVRLGGLGSDQGVIFARRAGDLARAHGARVLIEGSALEARRAGVAGIHSSVADLASITTRPPAPLWAATCESAADLDRAATLGADFGVLASPPIPDWDRVRGLTLQARLPVYLAADPSEAMIEAARRAGAAGIAAGSFGVARERPRASWRSAQFGDVAHAR